MLPSTLATQPCRGVPQCARHSRKTHDFSQPILVRVFACSAVDAPSVNALVALRDSFRCANRGPPVKLLANRLRKRGTLDAHMTGGSSDDAGLASTRIATTAEIRSWQGCRFGRRRRLLYRKSYASGLGRAPTPSPKRHGDAWLTTPDCGVSLCLSALPERCCTLITC